MNKISRAPQNLYFIKICKNLY